MEAAMRQAVPNDRELLDVLRRRRAHDERRGDLYQRLRALHDARRREVEQDTTRVQAELRAVRERLHLAECDATASELERHRAAGFLEDTASPTQRLCSTLRQTRALNLTLRTELASSTGVCERLRETVTAHTARNVTIAAALQQLEHLASSPQTADAAAHLDTATAPRLGALAQIARRSADFHATAFSHVSAELTAYIADQDSAASRVRMDTAALPALLLESTAAARQFLSSYRQIRGEQRAAHNTSLAALGGLDADAH